MRSWLGSPVVLVAATLGAYVAGGAVFRRTGAWLLHPVIVATVVMALGLRWAGVPVEEYRRGAQEISFFLAPSVVALGLTLHDERARLRARAGRIVSATAVGSLVGVASVVLIARALGAPRGLIASLAPKSVTTPIAMGISERLGGAPSLTGAIVIAVGALGAVAGPALLRALGVRSPLSFGLAMGSSAHGIGTARAVQEGPTQGAASALAIGLCGVFTALLAPPALWLLDRFWPAR